MSQRCTYYTDGQRLYQVVANGPQFSDLEDVRDEALHRVQPWELKAPPLRPVEACSDEEANAWWDARKQRAEA